MKRRAWVLALATILTLPLTSPHEAQAQSVSAEAAAQQRYAKGRELFFAKDYAGAAREFRAANELLASPNTRLYIARCEHELGHNAAAYVEYNRAAGEAADRARTDPRYASTRDHARAEGAALEGKIGRVLLKVQNAPDGTEVVVGGQALPRAGWDVPTPVDPGDVEVTATAPGRNKASKHVTVAAGQTAEVALALENAPPGAAVVAPVPPPPAAAATPPDTGAPRDATSPPLTEPPPEPEHGGSAARTIGFITLGVGAVGTAGFVAFAVMAKSKYDEIKDQCGGRRCDASYNGQIDDGQRLQLFANISLGVAAAGVVAGLILVSTGGGSTPDPPKTAKVRFFGAPLDGARGGMVGAHVGF